MEEHNGGCDGRRDSASGAKKGKDIKNDRRHTTKWVVKKEHNVRRKKNVVREEGKK